MLVKLVKVLTMTTKEQIDARILELDDDDLSELYEVIDSFVVKKKTAKEKRSFLLELQEIEIDGPEDFSVNFEQYASGEKQID